MALEQAARAITITGNILVTRQVNEARLEVASLAGTRRLARIAGGSPCPLCAYLDGRIVPIELADQIAIPSHINCDCIWSEVGDAEVGSFTLLDTDSPEYQRLVQLHGHFQTEPDKYAILSVPASPAGVDFTFRRRKDPQTGEVFSELEWHRPRYDLLPREGRGLDEATRQVGVTEIGRRPDVAVSL